MPPLPGEERVVTVFADVHAYFTTPVPKPLHHRFDKESYFYIYQNRTRQTSRLEIANHPGSPEQDAFNGSLNGVRIVSSYKFPTRLTLIVDPEDAESSTSSPSSSPPDRDPQEWRLPSADPREPGKYMYRLHTLDFYFWMEDDAKLVIDTMKRLLQPSQLDIVNAPQAENQQGERELGESRQEETGHEDSQHEDNMHPVIQNLEHVAISDPAYANGRTRNSQNQPSNLPPPTTAGRLSTSPIPPSESSSMGRSNSVNSAANYAPMAYNPASPPAPEPIAHREKTPPPADVEDGTGLAAAAAAEHGYNPAYGGPQAKPYTGVPGPVPSTFAHYASTATPAPPAYGSSLSPGPGAYGSPASSHAQPYNPSPSSTNSLNRPSTNSPYAPPPRSATSPKSGYDVAAAVTGQSFAPPPKDPNAHLYGSTANTPMQSPGTQIYGSSPFGQPHQPLQHIQPQYADYLSSKTQPPPGGYSQHSYDQQPQRQQQPSSAYDVHSQVYRPTEAEAKKPDRKNSAKPTDKAPDKPYDGSYQQGKIGERADKVEKGVNKYLKKFEKKFG